MDAAVSSWGWGRNGPKRDREMVEVYERHIKVYNSSNAMMSLASLLLKGGRGVPKDPQRAVQLLERAIRRGRSRAYLKLAWVYTVGESGFAIDWKRADELLESAIKKFDSCSAMVCLSRLLKRGGHGLQRDRARAFQLLERVLHKGGAREFGKEEVMIRMAKMLTCAKPGYPYDVHRGIRLYKQAIRADDSWGCCEQCKLHLAYLYAEGRPGLEYDLDEAVKWYKRAVNASCKTEAKVLLAEKLLNYSERHVRRVDVARAIELYRSAYEQDGSGAAMRGLSRLFCEGKLVKANMSKTIRYLRKAVMETGDAEDTHLLIGMLWFGVGDMKTDRSKALQVIQEVNERWDCEHLMRLYALVHRWAWHYDGLEADGHKSISMYEELVERFGDEQDKLELATLLLDRNEAMQLSEGQRRRGVQLYEELIEQSDDARAKWALACALQFGASHMRGDDDARAKRLFEAVMNDGSQLSQTILHAVTRVDCQLIARDDVMRSACERLMRECDDELVLYAVACHLRLRLKGMREQESLARALWAAAHALRASRARGVALADADPAVGELQTVLRMQGEHDCTADAVQARDARGERLSDVQSASGTEEVAGRDERQHALSALLWALLIEARDGGEHGDDGDGARLSATRCVAETLARAAAAAAAEAAAEAAGTTAETEAEEHGWGTATVRRAAALRERLLWAWGEGR